MDNKIETMPSIHIAISSTMSHARSSLPILIPSLIEAGVKTQWIHIFIGGYKSFATAKKKDIRYYFVDHNSFDYTALITITEMGLLMPDYWFLLHDTCRVGPNFLRLIRMFSGRPDKIALKHFPSMNIGLYSSTYLYSKKEEILKIGRAHV